MQKLIVLVLALLFPFSPSFAYDVFGSDANTIEVVESASRLEVGFRLCSLKGEFACKQIGKKAFYTKEKLLALRSSEKWDVLYSIGVDALLLAASGGGGAVLAYSGTVAGTTAATLYGTMAGGIVGAGMGTVTIALVDRLNPYEQYQQVQTLNSEVLNDERVEVSYPVRDFAKRLSAVLNNLDESVAE